MNYSDLHDFQKEAVNWMSERDRGFLWLKMGDGKTATAATALQKYGAPAVVVGTKRIVEDVWPAELKKWDHLSSLHYRSVTGSRKQREDALFSRADVIGLSYENLVWYLGMRDPKERPFWIFDEISKMKSPGSLRSRMMRKVPRLPRAFGLTATPTMEGHLGLWSQWKSVGGDDRLGRTITEFRQLFTTQMFRGNYVEYKISKPQMLMIEKLLAPNIFTIADSRRPYRSRAVTIDVPVKWSTAEGREHYKRMEKDLIADLETLQFAAASRGVAANKCRQLATGFIYDRERNAHAVDFDKFDAVREAVEELQGAPCLVFYQFEYEREILLDVLPGASPLEGHNYEDFNAGKIPVLVLHPKSCSHGLNLQNAQYVFYSSVPWSGEEYEQGVGRADRQGQLGMPVVKRFLRENSIDEEIAASVDGKITNQRELIQRIRERAA